MMRRCGHLFFLISCLAWASPVVLEATCGGGGGGGQGGVRPAEMTWTANVAEACQKASVKQKVVLLYFMPSAGEQSELHPIFIKYPPLAQMSATNFFVKIAPDEEAELRFDWKVPNDQHVIHVCDWFGNSLQSFSVAGHAMFQGRALSKTLSSYKRLSTKLKAQAEKQYKKGRKALKSKNYAQAWDQLKTLKPLRGFKILKKLPTLEDKIVAGAIEVVTASTSKDELDAMSENFSGLVQVEEAIAEAMKALGEEPASHRFVEPEHLASLIWDSMPDDYFACWDPVENPEVGHLIFRGALLEDEADYEGALHCYQQATVLDPDHALAWAYLGEMHRHHLGSWSLAEQAFEKVLQLNTDHLALAVARHGLGKMTIAGGDNQSGLALFAQSLQTQPLPLTLRNLAVYWNTEGDFPKALTYAQQAYDLDPADPYNAVFYAVYLLLDGQKDRSTALIESTPFHPSMSYNYACWHAAQGDYQLSLDYLHKHFYEYESTDAVRAHEMAEARMDIFFEPLYDDPRFKKLTHLAKDTPWLR